MKDACHVQMTSPSSWKSGSMNLVRLKNAQAQKDSRCSRTDVKFGAYKIAPSIEDLRFYDTVPTRQVFTFKLGHLQLTVKKTKYFSSIQVIKNVRGI